MVVIMASSRAVFHVTDHPLNCIRVGIEPPVGLDLLSFDFDVPMAWSEGLPCGLTAALKQGLMECQLS